MIPDDVTGYECRLVQYSETPDGQDDCLLVNRVAHLKDGTQRKELHTVFNRKRDFWVTNESKRVHKEKKTWANKSDLRKFTSTQCKLAENLSKALGKGGRHRGYRQLCSSPYVYGSDVPTTVLEKQKYRNKWPDLNGIYDIATLDFETDVVNGNGSTIISGSITTDDRRIIIYVESFMSDVDSPERRLQELYEHHIGNLSADLRARVEADAGIKDKGDKLRAADYLERVSKMGIEVYYAKTPGQLVVKILELTHTLQKDFVAIWSMDFDVPLMEAALKREGYDPKDHWTSPAVPPEFRSYEYDPGPTTKPNGTPRAFDERWPTVISPSGFYVVDAMCVFSLLRVQEGRRNSYALDNILREELDLGKLRFKEADHLEGLAWHHFMQSNYKLEYLIYNIFDCVSMLLLDQKTLDLGVTLGAMVSNSDFYSYPSTPTRLNEDYDFGLREDNMVLAAKAPNMTEELDEHLLSGRGIIITLPSHMNHETGVCAIKENPYLPTQFRIGVADIDVKSSYPSTGYACNMEKDTHVMDLCGIGTLPASEVLSVRLNMVSPNINAMMLSKSVYKFPSPVDLAAKFRERKARSQANSM